MIGLNLQENTINKRLILEGHNKYQVCASCFQCELLSVIMFLESKKKCDKPLEKVYIHALTQAWEQK